MNIVEGCTAAAPDALVQTLAIWHRFPSIYFSAEQYVLGEKGMKYSAWLIGPFLRPQCTTAEDCQCAWSTQSAFSRGAVRV